MRLSVVILNYNVSSFLTLCLQSVQEALTGIDSEIIVVDNNSDDDSCDMIRRDFPSVHLIENKVNLGFSKGNNIGVSKAKGTHVCILNPDTVVGEHTFSQLLEFIDKNQNVGALGCKLIDGRGRFLPESKRHVPTPMVALQKLFGYTSSYYFNELDEDSNGPCDILVGAFMLLQKRVFDEVGGFDEDFFMYGEDIDLSYRLLKAGYSNYYFGQEAVIHFKGESTLKNSFYLKRFYGAMKIFYRKHFFKNQIVDALVEFVIELASKRPNPTERSMADFDKVMLLSGQQTELTKVFDVPLNTAESVEQIKPRTMVVLDASLYTFQSMIDLMRSHANKSDIFYRIKPKKANFILGSDSSSSQGEILFLQDNP